MLENNSNLNLKRKYENQTATENDESEPKIPRGKKRTVSLLMMYSGWGYYGMQRSREFPTIEGELLKALLAANLISQEAFDSPREINFQRASKTDRNVSAIGQVCSLQLTSFENMVTKLNDLLPDQIRVIDLFRGTRTFNAKGNSDHRVYKYVMPSFAFAPKEYLEECHIYDQERVTDMQKLWKYRLPVDRLTLANETLLNFKGTKNYFNFTSGRGPSDPSCIRYMLSVTADSPILFSEKEFIEITITGQSFMLHQIRKMIGLTIAIVTGTTSSDIFNTAFETTRIDIPKAPGLGLLLDRVMYNAYNKRHCQDAPEKSIDWTRYEDQMKKFKLDVIYKDIFEKEIEQNSMADWMQSLDLHSYRYRESGPPSFLKPKATNNEDIETQSTLSSNSKSIDKPIGEAEDLANKTDAEPSTLKDLSFDDTINAENSVLKEKTAQSEEKGSG